MSNIDPFINVNGVDIHIDCLLIAEHKVNAHVVWQAAKLLADKYRWLSMFSINEVYDIRGSHEFLADVFITHLTPDEVSEAEYYAEMILARWA